MMQRTKRLGVTFLAAFAGLGLYWQYWQWQHKRIWQLGNAALLGETRKVNSLLDAGVPPDARNFHSRSALESAAYNGHLDVVRLLVDRGCDPGEGLVPAARKGRTDVLDLLVAKGAKVQGEAGASVLAYAVQSRSLDSVNLLLRHGVSINAPDDSGKPAVQQAAFNGSWEIFQTLVKQGADINARSSSGETTLMSAAKGNRADCLRICEYLIRHGMDVNATDDEGQTALIQCVYFASGSDVDSFAMLAILETLLQHGTDVNAQDKYGRTALRYATAAGNAPAKELLKRWHAESKAGSPAG